MTIDGLTNGRALLRYKGHEYAVSNISYGVFHEGLTEGKEHMEIDLPEDYVFLGLSKSNLQIGDAGRVAGMECVAENDIQKGDFVYLNGVTHKIRSYRGPKPGQTFTTGESQNIADYW